MRVDWQRILACFAPYCRQEAVGLGRIAFDALLGVLPPYLYVGEAIMRDMRDSLVSHLHRMPLSFFTSTETGRSAT